MIARLTRIERAGLLAGCLLAQAFFGGVSEAVPPLPDFVVDALAVEPRPAVAGRPLAVTAVVRNQGDAAGDARHLDVWHHWTNAVPPVFGDVGDTWAPVGRLEAGESRTVVLPPQILDRAGTNRLCARVEFENLVTESINTNNHFCVEYVAVKRRCELDFDGDGRSDIAVFHPALGNWFVEYSSRTNFPFAEPLGNADAVPVPGDYDGDGRTDLAVYIRPEGVWRILLSGQSENPLRIQQWGWKDAAPVPGDYDGDGKADLAVFHQAAGNWYIQYSSLGNAPVAEQFGWWETVPAPADYDGDGVTDIAVYCPSTGTWYIQYSLWWYDHGWDEIQWGWREAVPVPADYDGDGRADIAVFHRAAGNWYIKYSLQNNAPQAEQFGWWQVKPVPADYDGDGKTDIAVYYPGAGMWYIRKSTTGQMRQVQWGWKEALPTLLFPMLHDWYNLP